MSIQDNTPTLNPSFKHRHSVLGDEATSLHLQSAIETMAYQATNVLSLLSFQFLGEEESRTVSDEVIFWSIASAINTVKDMREMVAAYHLATSLEKKVIEQKQTGTKKPI